MILHRKNTETCERLGSLVSLAILLADRKVRENKFAQQYIDDYYQVWQEKDVILAKGEGAGTARPERQPTPKQSPSARPRHFSGSFCGSKSVTRGAAGT